MKKQIDTINNFYTDLEYDEDKYLIDSYSDHAIGERKDNYFVKRLSDNKTIGVFSGSITDIIQKDNIFIVASYEASLKGQGCQVTYYSEEGKDSLTRLFSYSCRGYRKVSDKTIYLEKDNYNGYLCNDKGLSNYFSRIYIEEGINELLGDNVVLVSEDRYARSDKSIKDTITYGINPDTFEIKTPIWSDREERYIDILSEEECLKKEEEIAKKGRYPASSTTSLGYKTIELEIQNTLDEIALTRKHGPSVYMPGTSGINKEFVKGFKN